MQRAKLSTPELAGNYTHAEVSSPIPLPLTGLTVANGRVYFGVDVSICAFGMY
jgi:hypothetical protein